MCGVLDSTGFRVGLQRKVKGNRAIRKGEAEI